MSTRLHLLAGLLLASSWAAAAPRQDTSTVHEATGRASTESSRARDWGLALDEYRRYETLMQGLRGRLSDPRITPIEVLGIHARNDAERRRYADLFARLIVEDTERVLQFQAAYRAALQRRYPALAAIDAGALQPGPARPRATAAAPPAAAAAPQLLPGDRLLLFASAACADCRPAAQRAMRWARRGAVTVDVYLLDASTPAQAREHADALGIDASLVREGRVTVNLDLGTMARLLPGRTALPQWVRKRGAQWVHLSSLER